MSWYRSWINGKPPTEVDAATARPAQCPILHRAKFKRQIDGLSPEAEGLLLVQALEKTSGNQTQAARLLRITRDTLRYKMKKFNLR